MKKNNKYYYFTTAVNKYNLKCEIMEQRAEQMLNWNNNLKSERNKNFPLFLLSYLTLMFDVN